MHFLNPQALWLLAVLPPLGVLAVWFAFKRKDQFIKDFGEARLVNRNSSHLEAGRYWLKGISVLIAAVALILAVARPAFEKGYTEIPVGTVDVIAIVDVSRSMAVQDYKGSLTEETDYKGGTRLDMARKLILDDVVPALKYNRLGVVSYAGEANPQAFLSDDLPALKWVLRRALTIGSAPGEGSELGKAFNLAFELFDLDSDNNHRKVIVLLSDGGNDAGLEALNDIVKQLRERNIELVIAGLGKTTPSAIPVSQLPQQDRDQFRGQEWYQVDGEVAMSALEENTLLWLKNATGARYVRVVNSSDFHIGNLLGRIEVKRKKGEQEVFFYPLLMALIFFGFAVFAPRERKDKVDGDEGGSGANNNLGNRIFKR
jgi:Ca-activated chloride channel family protein